MININKMQVYYGQDLALNITSPIHIDKGERIGIIGSNGAGKTTFINALLNLVPYKGNVDMDLKPNQIGVHLQSNNYTENLTVGQIIFAITGAKYNSDSRLKELVDYFDFKDSLRKKFKNLSGGQKQRCTLIMVLHQNKELVFFDEVTSGLDYETRQHLVKLLDRWYLEKNTTICYVSHYYEELDHLADKILLLDKGEVVCFGSKNELFQKYCGKSVYIVERSRENLNIFNEFEQLHSPDHLLVLKADSDKLDLKIAELLVKHNLNYKRTNNDIELMSFNAVKTFKEHRNMSDN